MLFWISDLKIIFNLRILWVKFYLGVFYMYIYIDNKRELLSLKLLIIYTSKTWSCDTHQLFLDIFMDSKLDNQNNTCWQKLYLIFLCICHDDTLHTNDNFKNPINIINRDSKVFWCHGPLWLHSEQFSKILNV